MEEANYSRDVSDWVHVQIILNNYRYMHATAWREANCSRDVSNRLKVQSIEGGQIQPGTKYGGRPTIAGTSVIGERYKSWREAKYSREISNRV
jgi:hypothetical protein